MPLHTHTLTCRMSFSLHTTFNKPLKNALRGRSARRVCSLWFSVFRVPSSDFTLPALLPFNRCSSVVVVLAFVVVVVVVFLGSFSYFNGTHFFASLLAFETCSFFMRPLRAHSLSRSLSLYLSRSSFLSGSLPLTNLLLWQDIWRQATTVQQQQQRQQAANIKSYKSVL